MTMEEMNVLCCTNLVRRCGRLSAWAGRPPMRPVRGARDCMMRTTRRHSHRRPNMTDHRAHSTTSRRHHFKLWPPQETFDFEAQLPQGLWKRAADQLNLR